MLIKIFDSLSLVFVYANYILHTHFKYSNIELSYILSECVLFNDKWNLFSYIIRTGYIQWNDDNIRFVLYSYIIIPANLCTVLGHYYPSQPLYCTRTLLSQPTFVLYSDIIIPANLCTVLGHYYPSHPLYCTRTLLSQPASQRSSNYQFHSLWFDPNWTRTSRSTALVAVIRTITPPM